MFVGIVLVGREEGTWYDFEFEGVWSVLKLDDTNRFRAVEVFMRLFDEV